MLAGVLQGYILGPLLFVLFINDMQNCISPLVSIVLYADDSQIWRTIVNYSDHIALQRDIARLQKWYIENKMTLRPNNCTVLSVFQLYEEPILPFDRFSYCLDNVCLDYVNSQIDLGIYMNCRLNWTGQCNVLISKANTMLNLVRRTCHFTKCKNQKMILLERQ